mgnify:CR=1 FL=1|tara:strand:+ start:535 stop:744 length:210 start_codon:yes stop_codon:yes gene_type:complete
MYNQSVKAYAKINALVESKKPEEVTPFRGLLARVSPKKEEPKENSPQDTIVEMVSELRKARMSFKNGKS